MSAAPASLDALDLVTRHFANVFYFDLGRYLIAASVMTLVLWAGGRWLELYRIQHSRRAKPEDYRREVLSSLRTVFVFGVTTLSTLAMKQAGLVRFSIEGIEWWVLALQAIAIILAHDAYFYWMHRAIHHKRLFRTWHLHHHKSRTPTPWAAYSFAAPEAVVEAAFVPAWLLIVTTLGIEYHGLAMFLFLWHMIIRNVIGHCGVEIYPAGWVDNPLTGWWNTVTHHDLHHSAGTWNFGLYFTWWDRWMGTEHPRYRETFREVKARRREVQTEAVPAE
ncbi:sterol desaturase family protein [Erythrobacter donghaensis]|jgi:sterol desaturase/sphingolipid hydroxylase (fatty acid hydroxylase superfamily)|uniref:sterol desaturase family protein n=1 Tax=Erythrobacter donghaensis TaxID=267135 RepID=UPI0009BCB570|nr:sterol desaturase family protein [Erythrobacter donghaensis]